MIMHSKFLGHGILSTAIWVQNKFYSSGLSVNFGLKKSKCDYAVSQIHYPSEKCENKNQKSLIFDNTCFKSEINLDLKHLSCYSNLVITGTVNV